MKEGKKKMDRTKDDLTDRQISYRWWTRFLILLLHLRPEGSSPWPSPRRRIQLGSQSSGRDGRANQHMLPCCAVLRTHEQQQALNQSSPWTLINSSGFSRPANAGWSCTTLWKLLFLLYKNKIGKENWLCQRPMLAPWVIFIQARWENSPKSGLIAELLENTMVPLPPGSHSPVHKEVANSNARRGQARNTQYKVRPAHGKMKNTFLYQVFGFFMWTLPTFKFWEPIQIYFLNAM